MLYPKLKEIPTSRDLIDVFKGYNHNLRIGEGEFYEMKNLSSDSYPVLSPRGKRGIYASPSNPCGMVAKDSLCYVDGGDFIINEYRVQMGLTVDKDEKGEIIPKTLISMGAYVIIMPDKKYINTTDFDYNGSRSDFGSIDKEFVSSEGTAVGFQLCRENGTIYTNLEINYTPPEITEEMEKDPSKIPYWLATGGAGGLYQYSVSESSWLPISNTYIKISSPGIGLGFSVGDGVTIEGVKEPATINGPAVIQAKDESKSDWIVVKGFIDTAGADASQSVPVRITRTMPELDFVIESGNRLWGCRYGVQGDKIVNEIYASKLGDFKNWNCFAGISTDSYAASVGTDGQFTGAITYLGYPLFFKEGCIHKVYGLQRSAEGVREKPCHSERGALLQVSLKCLFL